jgi:hypothetical protein
MHARPPETLPIRNPVTTAKHRRETFWQITFPFILVLLVFLGAAGGVIYAALTGQGHPSLWADTSAIWLALLMMGMLLPVLIILAGLVYGVIYLIRVLPPYAYKTQRIFWLVNRYVAQTTDKLAEPVLRVHSLWAMLKTLTKPGHDKS